MKQLKVVESEPIYAQAKELGKLFGLSRRKIAYELKDMYESPNFKGGIDYINLSATLKLIRISSFERLLASKHLKWLRE